MLMGGVKVEEGGGGGVKALGNSCSAQNGIRRGDERNISTFTGTSN